MKRSGFRKQSISEIKAKQAIKRAKPKVKKVKKKSKSQAQLKKKLDAVFSKYIRQIHPARCYTCGISKHRKNLQCGHFISRQYLMTRWHENNCRPQCVGCNVYGNGKPLDFEENLKRELGDQYVEDMKKTRHQMLKVDSHWYHAEIEKYQALLDE
jgi:hypothetical protein